MNNPLDVRLSYDELCGENVIKEYVYKQLPSLPNVKDILDYFFDNKFFIASGGYRNWHNYDSTITIYTYPLNKALPR